MFDEGDPDVDYRRADIYDGKFVMIAQGQMICVETATGKNPGDTIVIRARNYSTLRPIVVHIGYGTPISVNAPHAETSGSFFL